MTDTTTAAPETTSTPAPASDTLLTTPVVEAAATTESTDASTAAPETTDAKPTADDPAKAGEDKAAEQKPAVPEKYEFTAPEGINLDAEAVAKFEPIARELGLSNDQAQKLVSLQSEFVKQQADAWAATETAWMDTIKSDAEVGGKNLDSSVKHAQTALSKYGTPELSQALNDTRMGNHPEVLRLLSRIGKAMAEDTFIGEKPVQTKSAAERLYPNHKP